MTIFFLELQTKGSILQKLALEFCCFVVLLSSALFRKLFRALVALWMQAKSPPVNLLPSPSSESRQHQLQKSLSSGANLNPILTDRVATTRLPTSSTVLLLVVTQPRQIASIHLLLCHTNFNKSFCESSVAGSLE